MCGFSKNLITCFRGIDFAARINLIVKPETGHLKRPATWQKPDSLLNPLMFCTIFNLVSLATSPKVLLRRSGWTALTVLVFSIDDAFIFSNQWWKTDEGQTIVNVIVYLPTMQLTLGIKEHRPVHSGGGGYPLIPVIWGEGHCIFRIWPYWKLFPGVSQTNQIFQWISNGGL